MAAPDPEPPADGAGRDEGVEPEFPDEAGVGVPAVPIEKVEPERMLENDDDQILRWVEAYFAEHDEGEPDDVVAWIRDQEAPARHEPRRNP